MTHADAIELIRQGGNTVRLLVKRGSRLSQPTCKYDLVYTLNKMEYLKVPYLKKENFEPRWHICFLLFAYYEINNLSDTVA